MKYLFFSFYNKSPILETEGEIIKNLLKNKDNEVHIFYLSQILIQDAPFIWPKKKRIYKFLDFMLPEKKMLGLINNERLIVHNFDISEKKNFFLSYKNNNDLKKIKYKNFDIGLGILSSLITTEKNPNIQTKEFKKRIDYLLQSGSNFFDFASEKIDLIKPDKIYLFNSRFLYPRAVLRAAQRKKITYQVFERGSRFNTYYIYDRSLLSIKDWEYNVNKVWTLQKNKKKMFNDIKRWFKSRIKGSAKFQHWRNYTKNQKKNFIHKNKKLKIVVFFASSEDEYAANENIYKSYFKSQVGAIKAAINVIKKLKNHILIIRPHPRLISENFKKEMHTLENLKKYSIKNKIIFHDAGTKINTYSLIKCADTILSLGSTTGLEAAYMGKKHILLGRARYGFLKFSYEAKNKNLLKKFILSKKIKNNSGIFKFLNYIINRNIKFKYFQFYKSTEIEPYRGKFMGKDLMKKNIFEKIILKFLKIY